MEKYYTPTIEEFHVGFEYEFFDTTIEEWQPATIKDGTQIDDIHKSRHGEDVYKLRVKYLDHEDIVLEGWDKWSDKKNEYLLISKDGTKWYLAYSPDTYTVNIYCGAIMCFSGTLRNRSELKVLMKQINIAP